METHLQLAVTVVRNVTWNTIMTVLKKITVLTVVKEVTEVSVVTVATKITVLTVNSVKTYVTFKILLAELTCDMWKLP